MCNITLKNVLRRVHPIKGFVYHSVGWDPEVPEVLRAEVREREGCRGRCSGCGRKAPGYPTNVAGPVDVSGYLLEQLMGSNSRAIVFLEVQTAKLRPKGPGQSGFYDGAFVDPWGDPYQIAFDLTYRSTLNGVGPKSENIRKSVAVWNDPAKGDNKDKYPTQLERRHAESW